MNHRRKLLIALGSGALVNPLAARAQAPPAKPRRIGFLALGSAQGNAAYLPAFRAGMLELRWVEGADYVIDARYASGVAQALPGLADELLAIGPDLMLTPSEGSARLLAQKTRTIPIVFAIASDPVGNGLAASLRRPGGNVTGLTTLSTELSAKRLQLLKEVFPRVAHVALLFEPDHMGSASQAQEIADMAPRLGMRITAIKLRLPADIEAGLKRAAALGAQAYVVAAGGFATSQRQAIAARLIRLKAPSMFGNSQDVEAGGLMSYAASFTDNFRRAAGYADKILKGAKPGELPIQQPVTFDLVVNLKTAKAIGLTVPPIVMLQATRVIE